jgi:hypothetical protein
LKNKLKAWFLKLVRELKQIILTKEGWLAWFLANVIVNIPVIAYLIAYFVTVDPKYLATAGVIYALMWAPPPIETFIVALLTPVLYKIILKIRGRTVS